MRIGIDCRLWNESGVGRYTRNLVQQLSVLDNENEYVLFILSKDSENFKFQISNFKFQIRTADVRWHSLAEQVRFLSILNKEKLDLMHFTYFSIPIFYKKPYVITIHDLILHHFATGEASTLPLFLYKTKLFFYRYVILKAARNARKIITVSEATRSEIISHLNVKPEKIVVTYEGVDEKITNSKLQIPNKLEILNSKLLDIEHERYFLYVGNAYPHKNLKLLIESFDKLQKDNGFKNVQLILVGKEDHFYKKIKDFVKNNKISNVIFYGEANDNQLASLYKNALALVLPSLMEGFGLPAVEAMQNECPLLVSGISVFKEICANATVYFNPHDSNELTEKMKDFISGKINIKKNIKEGLSRVKLFSWEKMAKETLHVYTRISSS